MSAELLGALLGVIVLGLALFLGLLAKGVIRSTLTEAFHPKQAYCAGCDENRPARQMGWNDIGLYRCHVCRAPEKALEAAAAEPPKDETGGWGGQHISWTPRLETESVGGWSGFGSIFRKRPKAEQEGYRWRRSLDGRKRRQVQCLDCSDWLADTLKVFPEFNNSPLCFGCLSNRRSRAKAIVPEAERLLAEIQGYVKWANDCSSRGDAMGAAQAAKNAEDCAARMDKLVGGAGITVTLTPESNPRLKMIASNGQVLHTSEPFAPWDWGSSRTFKG